MLENLKILRARENMSQAELAKAVGTSQQSIAHYEQGNVNPGLPTLTRLADFFHTSIDYIVGRTRIDRPVEDYTESDLNTAELVVMEEYRSMNDEQRYIFNHSMRLLKDDGYLPKKGAAKSGAKKKRK